MSLAARSFTWIAQLGWGGAVFVGFGAACIFMLVAAAFLAAWRLFRPLAPPPSADKGPPASREVEREKVSPFHLYVGRMHADFAPLTENLAFSISVCAFNGSGHRLRVSAIQGSVRYGGPVSDPRNKKLPPAAVSHDPATTILPYSEFTVSIEQRVERETALAIGATLDGGEQARFDFDSFNVMVESCDGTLPPVRVPLWNGMSCWRAASIITGRTVYLEARAIAGGQGSAG